MKLISALFYRWLVNLTLFRFAVIFDCKKVALIYSISMQPCLTKYGVVSCCFRLIASEACSPIRKAISVVMFELRLQKKKIYILVSS